MFSFSDFNQFWANEQQQLLLKACLLDYQTAKTAYEQWISQVNIDLLDGQSNQLLGLLYRNLTQQNIDSEHIGRLKGINRYQWTKNQLVINQYEQIAQQFQQANIDLICFDDIAILSHCYQDSGSKSLINLGLLIHQEDFSEAEELLTNLGWQLQTNLINTRLHSNNLWFKNDKNQNLVCKSSLFMAKPQQNTDSQIWQQAIEAKISRSNYKTLNTIDTILLTCLQANRQERLPITKTVDVVLLMNKENIDWVELITKAQRYRLILPVTNMLSFIKNVLGVALPDWLLPSLYEMPIADYELLNYRIPALAKGLKLKSLFLKAKQTIG